MSRQKHNDYRITTPCPFCGAACTPDDDYCTACGRGMNGGRGPGFDESDAAERMESGSVSDRLAEGFGMMNQEDGL